MKKRIAFIFAVLWLTSCAGRELLTSSTTTTSSGGSSTGSVWFSVSDSTASSLLSDVEVVLTPVVISKTNHYTNTSDTFGDCIFSSVLPDYYDVFFTKARYQMLYTNMIIRRGDFPFVEVPVQRETGSLELAISNSTSALDEVVVSIAELGISATNLSDGSLSMSDLPWGEYELLLTKSGYSNLTTNLTVVENTAPEFSLQMGALSGSVQYNIVAYNVEDFSNSRVSVSESFEGIARFISTNGGDGADVIVFEEIQTPDEAPLSNALASLGYVFPYFVYSDQPGMDDEDVWYNDYVAVASRYPISDVDSILSGNNYDPVSGSYADAPRNILKFKVTFDGGNEVWFYGCHLKASSGEENVQKRCGQAYALQQYILTNHDVTTENVILLGDMNTGLPDYEIRDTNTLNILCFENDADGANDFTPVNYNFLSGTFTHSVYWSYLDHILLSPAAMSHYVSGSVTVPTNWYSTNDALADHYPVYLDLEF